ncbi:MAG: RloB family protein [Myxococcota bacterium]
MKKKPSRRRRGSIKRKAGRKAGRRVLIVCEGEKTEPKYFDGLRRCLKLVGVEVQVVRSPNSDPVSVVNHAVKLCRKESRLGAPYDHAWCVVDRDDHEVFETARAKARRAKLELAVSVRCFEFWLLLHYEYTTAPHATTKDVVRKLRAHWRGYNKGCSLPDDLLERRHTAAEHSRRVRSHHAGVAGETFPNPSTTVDKLVEALEAFADRR